MSTTIFNGIITTINLADNLTDGLSHYYSEVRRVKETALLIRDGGKVFVIFDELFRGTNVKDAFDASLLIIRELTQVTNSVFLISTHIVELAEEFKSHPNVAFKYMDTYFDKDHPVFSYKLLEGVSKERLGMYIVKNEGIIEIIQEAIKNKN
jgi:DNA mismatch repair protein MutS